MNLVAVYGTLKKKHFNHRVMERQNGVYIGPGITKERYNMFDGAFPRVIEGNTSQIHVEVYAVHGFKYLDALEGHPHHFKRKQIEILGYKDPVWMYIYQSPVSDGRLLTGGVWNRTDNDPF